MPLTAIAQGLRRFHLWLGHSVQKDCNFHSKNVNALSIVIKVIICQSEFLLIFPNWKSFWPESCKLGAVTNGLFGSCLK